MYGVGIAKGIMGIKEIIDDKNIHDILSEINQNNAIDPKKIQKYDAQNAINSLNRWL